MPKRLNWTLILLLSIIGDAMGLRGVYNFLPGSEPYLWLGFGILTAFIIGRIAPGRFFLHGFIVGLLWGIFSALIEFAYFDLYLANNPGYAAEFDAIKAVRPEVYLMLFGTVVGIATGLVLGGLSWLFRKRRSS